MTTPPARDYDPAALDRLALNVIAQAARDARSKHAGARLAAVWLNTTGRAWHDARGRYWAKGRRK